jgi:hypothetical protein
MTVLSLPGQLSEYFVVKFLTRNWNSLKISMR